MCLLMSSFPIGVFGDEIFVDSNIIRIKNGSTSVLPSLSNIDFKC